MGLWEERADKYLTPPMTTSQLVSTVHTGTYSGLTVLEQRDIGIPEREAGGKGDQAR